jgi:GT2 family glycosyltransferase
VTSIVPTVSVLVPTWRRPGELSRCLRALAAQTEAPMEVVVGLRADDSASWALLDVLEPELGVKLVRAPSSGAGVIAAMNAALAQCRGEIIALTDDDAEPRRDWIERITRAFTDPRVAGVGGRDWQPLERGDRTDVGRVQWFGRVIGNHHLGAGPARAVDVLKGANAAFRAPLLRDSGFDTRLEGSGAQMFWELALCLPLRRAGWTLIYDPAISVEHHIAPRHDDDQRHRGVFAAAPQVQAVHNETLVLLEHQRGLARIAFITWALLVGTQIEPGVVQAARLVLAGDRHALARWRWTLVGRWRGWRHWREGPAVDAASRVARAPA